MKITIDPVQAPKKFKKFGKLPGRPSELISVALRDLEAAEKAGLKIDMGHWIAVKDDDKRTCTVCFAGAVMAYKLGNRKEVKNILAGKNPDNGEDLTRGLFHMEGDPLADVGPFGAEENALEAINSFRVGALEDAFSSLSLDLPEHFLAKVNVVDYHRNKLKFKKQMKELAKTLAKEGY